MRLFNKILFLLLLTFCLATASAQQEDVISYEADDTLSQTSDEDFFMPTLIPGEKRVRYDSTHFRQLRSSDFVEEVRGDSDFQYPIDVKSEFNLWDFIWNEIIRWIFSNSLRTDRITIMHFIILAIVTGAVILTVLWLRRQGTGSIFSKSDVDGGLDFDEIADINEVDLGTLIKNSINRQDYREAVRLLYLKSLQRMSEKELIKWRKDATNREYINQLDDYNYRERFSKLTLQFEYINYGEFPIDKENFDEIKYMFDRYEAILGGSR